MTEERNNESIQTVIQNTKGLHARAAAQVVTLSNQFDCQIVMSHKDRSADCSSLIKLLTLDAPKGSHVTITATGKQKNIAIKELNKLINQGFGE